MAKKQRAVKKQRQTRTAAPEMVTWALHGIQQAIDAARARLEDLEAQARRLRGATRAAAAAAVESLATDTAPVKPARAAKKRKLSAEARKRIADAQKRRWAKVRATKATS